MCCRLASRSAARSWCLASINLLMAAGVSLVALALAFAMYRLAKRGTPLHKRYAQKAAAVDGELVDVIGNMGIVRIFGATLRERARLSGKIGLELVARERSLKYLERLRLIHALVTIVLTAGLLGWALLLWTQGAATPGDVVLVSSLGFAILHGTRDLAVALVDLTQHIARLTEAVSTLLIPHALPDAPNAQPLQHLPGHGVPPIVFEGWDFPIRSASWFSTDSICRSRRANGLDWSARRVPANRPS